MKHISDPVSRLATFLRLRREMSDESTIDVEEHTRQITQVVVHAKRHAHAEKARRISEEAADQAMRTRAFIEKNKPRRPDAKGD